MEMEKQEVRTRRSRKHKEKSTRSGGGRKKGCVTPVAFKLHTALLAERREQQVEDKEVAHLRHAQQKILGKKTVEDFAQLKLIRRGAAADSRSRSLHCNEGLHNSKNARERIELCSSSPELPVHVESRPLLSARTPNSTQPPENVRQRPQSAKPVLQSQQPRSTTTHSTAVSSSTEKKRRRKKKDKGQKTPLLSPSESAPVLSNTSATRNESSPTCKKISIIVNMRRLQLDEEIESPRNDISSITTREAWAVTEQQELKQHV